jgi:hypothetical protein
MYIPFPVFLFKVFQACPKIFRRNQKIKTERNSSKRNIQIEGEQKGERTVSGPHPCERRLLT